MQYNERLRLPVYEIIFQDVCIAKSDDPRVGRAGSLALYNGDGQLEVILAPGQWDAVLWVNDD